VDQQKSLNELAQTMEVQIRSRQCRPLPPPIPEHLPELMAAQEAIITQLR